MTKAKIEQEVRAALAAKSFITPARARRIMSTVSSMLPQLKDLSSGILVIGVRADGVQTCTGGHLCGGDGPSPGDTDDPDCGTEACTTQICEDSHVCGDQSCGTESCSDDAHACTGEYKGIIDIGAMSATRAAAWTALQAEVQRNVAASNLDVQVKVER
ncbi:hypothetical protein [Sorangium sp. So ce1389]|uniref:hypothetical protein n=1 Tax=Sorangium sp. So ce1389 TaxID=3133336 RepID=UPI003F60E4DF